jgi:hypothetical protein
VGKKIPKTGGGSYKTSQNICAGSSGISKSSRRAYRIGEGRPRLP